MTGHLSQKKHTTRTRSASSTSQCYTLQQSPEVLSGDQIKPAVSATEQTPDESNRSKSGTRLDSWETLSFAKWFTGRNRPGTCTAIEPQQHLGKRMCGYPWTSLACQGTG